MGPTDGGPGWWAPYLPLETYKDHKGQIKTNENYLNGLRYPIVRQQNN